MLYVSRFTSSMRLTFTIQRFNPEVDSTPHPQEIRLDVGRGMTVLDALIRIKQRVRRESGPPLFLPLRDLRLLCDDDQRQREAGLPHLASQRT